jgi:hypothetical protein
MPWGAIDDAIQADDGKKVRGRAECSKELSRDIGVCLGSYVESYVQPRKQPLKFEVLLRRGDNTPLRVQHIRLIDSMANRADVGATRPSTPSSAPAEIADTKRRISRISEHTSILLLRGNCEHQQLVSGDVSASPAPSASSV